MILILKFLSFIAHPFIHILYHIRVKNGKEEKARQDEKFGIPTIKKKDGDYVWFHGASVGEIRSLSLLIPSYKENFLDNILITTTTKTGQETAKKLFPYASIQYIPYDLHHFFERFLNYWSPSWCCLVDSEIWPCMIHLMHKKGIRLYLINGKLSNKSFNFWKRFSFLSVFPKFRCIWTTSKELQEKFLDLKAKHSIVFPNLKFFAPKLDITDDFFELEKWINKRPSWCMASTHPFEEEIAISLHKKLAENVKDLVTIIIPRHPNRAHGFKDVTFSSSLNNNSSILMHDKLGGLGTFYELSRITVMGKTFSNPGGGHNPIEPLLFQNLVIFGKDMSNFRDITQIWAEQTLSCQNENELFECLKFYIQNNDELEKRVKPVYSRLLEIRKKGIGDLIDEIGR